MSKELTVKELRALFHGCDVTASIQFEIEGEVYRPLSLVEKSLVVKRGATINTVTIKVEKVKK